MTSTDVHGPVDFVLIEFTGDRVTGRTAQALLDLVERGIVRVYDILMIGEDTDGSVFGIDLAESADSRVGSFTELAGARSGLLSDDDVREAGSAMEPGTLAALIIYENTWAIPFVTAAREAGGELVASARIPATDVMAALDALESLETTSSGG
jgi:hypothetical protein